MDTRKLSKELNKRGIKNELKDLSIKKEKINKRYKLNKKHILFIIAWFTLALASGFFIKMLNI